MVITFEQWFISFAILAGLPWAALQWAKGLIEHRYVFPTVPADDGILLYGSGDYRPFYLGGPAGGPKEGGEIEPGRGIEVQGVR